MKIVVLDGYTLNQGERDWEELNELGEVTVYDRTEQNDVIRRSEGAEVVLTNKVVLDRSTIEHLPDLKYIGVLATGYNIIDLNAAREHGIVVTNIPAYSTDSVVQMAFAHILNITLRVGHYAHEVHNGVWSAQPDFSCPHKMDTKLPKEYEKAKLNDVFSTCDIVSLHCPLTPETKEMVNSFRLSLMKQGAILINTGRGGLIDEKALERALLSGKLLGAGLDVLSSEPPSVGNPLLKLNNCFIRYTY